MDLYHRSKFPGLSKTLKPGSGAILLEGDRAPQKNHSNAYDSMLVPHALPRTIAPECNHWSRTLRGLFGKRRQVQLVRGLRGESETALTR